MGDWFLWSDGWRSDSKLVKATDYTEPLHLKLRNGRLHIKTDNQLDAHRVFEHTGQSDTSSPPPAKPCLGILSAPAWLFSTPVKRKLNLTSLLSLITGVPLQSAEAGRPRTT